MKPICPNCGESMMWVEQDFVFYCRRPQPIPIHVLEFQLSFPVIAGEDDPK